MNCRVTYNLTVEGLTESRGSFIILDVETTAEATSRATARIQPILDQLRRESITKGLSLMVHTLPDEVPESAHAAVNALRCHAWPLLAVAFPWPWCLWLGMGLIFGILAGLLYRACERFADWLRDRSGVAAAALDGPRDEEREQEERTPNT